MILPKYTERMSMFFPSTGVFETKSDLMDFGKLLRSDLTTDSLRSIFREVATGFECAFFNYFYRLAITPSLAKRKALLFSTSMSCECTLRMCGEYTEALYALKRKMGDDVRILIVDTFRNPKLNSQYKVDFVPVIVVLDETNTELARFVREEQISIKLATMFR